MHFSCIFNRSYEVELSIIVNFRLNNQVDIERLLRIQHRVSQVQPDLPLHKASKELSIPLIITLLLYKPIKTKNRQLTLMKDLMRIIPPKVHPIRIADVLHENFVRNLQNLIRVSSANFGDPFIINDLQTHLHLLGVLHELAFELDDVGEVLVAVDHVLVDHVLYRV